VTGALSYAYQTAAKVFRVYYSTTREWPAKSLARRNAVLAKVK
jgi:hypothetical protein